VRVPACVGAGGLLLALLARTTAGATERPTTDIVTASSPAGVAAREAIRAAVALLPRTPKIIAVMDITTAKPEVRDNLRRLDAFTVQGNGVIYLVDGSELLRGAQVGSAFYRAALAAVIWHEMAHLDGANSAPRGRRNPRCGRASCGTGSWISSPPCGTWRHSRSGRITRSSRRGEHFTTGGTTRRGCRFFHDVRPPRSRTHRGGVHRGGVDIGCRDTIIAPRFSLVLFAALRGPQRQVGGAFQGR
jgi:hypothetical protein